MKVDVSYKSILNIALPIMVMGLSHTAIIIADTAFMGRLSSVAVGAVGNASLFYFIPVLFAIGFGVGIQIIVGRRNGEENYQQIGPVFHQGLYMLLGLACITFFSMMLFSNSLFGAISSSEEMARLTAEYIETRAFAYWFTIPGAVMQGFFIGIGRTRIIGIGNAIMALLNIFLNYLLIFGNWGFPEMGVNGAAMASGLSELVLFLVYLLGLLFTVDLKHYKLNRLTKISWSLIKRINKVAGPSSLQNLLAMSAWFIFFTLIGRIGEDELAISHIVRAIYMIFIIPLMGLADATSTIISNVIGEKRFDDVKTVIIRGIILGFSITACLVIPVAIFPIQVLSLFTSINSLQEQAIPLLHFIFFVVGLFILAMVMLKAVDGSGQTKVALLIEAITIFAYIAFAYVAVEIVHVSFITAWFVEAIYMLGLFLGSLLFFKFGNWKNVEIG